MKEYIEREAALACKQPIGAYGMDISSEDIKAIPTADVAEVRHGRWIWDDDGMDWGLGAWKCSECRCNPETWWEAHKGNPCRCSGSHYCPNCGAKMTEV